MKYNLVKIEDKYAVRKTEFFFKTYLDFRYIGKKYFKDYWRCKDSLQFEDCLVDKELAEKELERFINYENRRKLIKKLQKTKNIIIK